MPVLKYRLFCVVSFANVKNIGLLNVYQYSRFTQFSLSVGCVYLHIQSLKKKLTGKISNIGIKDMSVVSQKN
jgi:hypothetical protein